MKKTLLTSFGGRTLRDRIAHTDRLHRILRGWSPRQPTTVPVTRSPAGAAPAFTAARTITTLPTAARTYHNSNNTYYRNSNGCYAYSPQWLRATQMARGVVSASWNKRLGKRQRLAREFGLVEPRLRQRERLARRLRLVEPRLRLLEWIARTLGFLAPIGDAATPG